MIDHSSRSTWGPGSDRSGFRAQKMICPPIRNIAYDLALLKLGCYTKFGEDLLDKYNYQRQLDPDPRDRHLQGEADESDELGHLLRK